IKAIINRRRDALLVLMGALMVIICALHDMLYQNNLILSNYGEMIPIGLFILLFMQSFVLARRFSEAFRHVEALSQKLLKLDKIKDEFLANTSHELRTPLNGILGITEGMLRGSEGALSDGQKQNLAIISSSGRRLTNLVNDILDYSKLKHGDLRLNIKPIRVDGLIQTVVKVFQQLSSSKEIVVLSDLPPELPPALADENRLVQILYNLIGNAVKFTKQGYVKVSARVSQAMLEVCVSDTGEGIPQDKLEDIFKSFEQVDTSLTRKHGGTGLGLSITKQLVELEGGSIWVKSTPGSGSEFYFTLPMAAELPGENDAQLDLPEPVVQVLEQQPLRLNQAVGGGNILLVDDDPVNLQSSATLLQIGGYGVTAVNCGKGALEELAKRQDYELAILDVMMPEISGYEVCRKIRENKSHFEIPVLILTAKTTVADIVMGFEAGANDYLPKPFEPEELLARVGTLVNLKKSVDKALTAEVAFMQAQIKPHFLFNTLNTISSFCDTNPDQARRLIEDFSNYLRQSFDFKNLSMYVPLTNEINMVKSYVEIEKARFGDQLKVEFTIDEALEVKIPSLSIQPLVENAIRHGIRKKGGGGAVTISIKNTTTGVLVTVADDGVGIAPDKLARIMEVDTGRGVGLWNIDFRLRKLCGKGLTIESEPGKGVRVTFVIPSEVGF
ncbi:MAG TPA: ATP-binding protein, partial [Bacillota bacterium]|nr:ATP-binding protein [Bacillota bacterium]